MLAWLPVRGVDVCTQVIRHDPVTYWRSAVVGMAVLLFDMAQCAHPKIQHDVIDAVHLVCAIGAWCSQGARCAAARVSCTKIYKRQKPQFEKACAAPTIRATPSVIDTATSNMATDLTFIEPADVKELITGDNKDSVLVVDVRDDVREV